MVIPARAVLRAHRLVIPGLLRGASFFALGIVVLAAAVGYALIDVRGDVGGQWLPKAGTWRYRVIAWLRRHSELVRTVAGTAFLAIVIVLIALIGMELRHR